MQVSRLIRILLALAVGLLSLLLLIVLLYLTQSAFEVWGHLKQTPGWFLAAYAAGLLGLAAGIGWILWRLLMPRRRPAARPQPPKAPPSEAELEQRVALAEQAGIDVARVRRELARLRERRAAGHIYVSLFGEISSGKSSLINETLLRQIRQEFKLKNEEKPGANTGIMGLEYIDKVVDIDQSPIGRTPRSNPATYTKAFDEIRELFALTRDAKVRGFKAGRFSFNVKGGRCEACRGDGQIKIEMQFMPDIYVDCEVCGGKRYNHEALEIEYKGRNISQVLEMTVDEGLVFFDSLPKIQAKLQTLSDVGLGYIHLGQPAPTLSGGEAQRVKLSAELARRQTGKTLYILDEPTTGLHFADLERLITIFKRLVFYGNTVIVIEHNLDVVRFADWIIDLGPEGGTRGGRVVAEGSVAQIVATKKSWTGQYLKAYQAAKK